MQIIDAFKIAVMQKYATFSGRANRAEFWYFILANLLIYFALGIVSSVWPKFAGILLGIFAIGMVVPSLAVTIRRLHDTGRSGWFYLITLVPLVGGLILLYFLVQSGNEAANNYGEPSTNLREPKEDVLS